MEKLRHREVCESIKVKEQGIVRHNPKVLWWETPWSLQKSGFVELCMLLKGLTDFHGTVWRHTLPFFLDKTESMS